MVIVSLADPRRRTSQTTAKRARNTAARHMPVLDFLLALEHDSLKYKGETRGGNVVTVNANSQGAGFARVNPNFSATDVQRDSHSCDAASAQRSSVNLLHANVKPFLIRAGFPIQPAASRGPWQIYRPFSTQDRLIPWLIA